MASQETTETSTEVNTKSSLWQTSLPKDWTWRSNRRITGSPSGQSRWQRCLLNSILENEETIAQWHTELTAEQSYQRPMNWLLQSQQMFHRCYLPRWPREVDQECTEAVRKITLTEKHSTETLRNAESTDAEIRKCNVQSSIPRSEAHSSHGEYDHLLWCLHVRYGSMIYLLCMIQLASILPPSNSHQLVSYENRWLWHCQEGKLTSMWNVKMSATWWSTIFLILPWPISTIANA